MTIKRADGQYHDWLGLGVQAVTIHPALDRVRGNKPAPVYTEMREFVMDRREYLMRLAWSVLAWHEPIQIQVRHVPA